MSPPGIAAVDIGGTKIAVGVVDDGGHILAQAHGPTAPTAGFEAAMSRVDSMLEAARIESGRAFRGIGIGCTGPVDPITGEIGLVDFLPGWSGCNPVAYLTKRFGVDVALENDADALALGELAWGAGRTHRNLLAVCIGTGIGGGIIVDGKLYRGVDGAHPEIGHHVIDPAGPSCFCGAQGCWEALASGTALAQRLSQRAPEAWPSGTLTAERVCELARAGDALARQEIDRHARYLGIGVANLVTLFAPDVIVLAGSVMRSADLFLPTIREYTARQCGLVPASRIEIVTSPLEPDAPLIGAAMVFEHRFGGAALAC
jgi:glucokinase